MSRKLLERRVRRQEGRRPPAGLSPLQGKPAAGSEPAGPVPRARLVVRRARRLRPAGAGQDRLLDDGRLRRLRLRRLDHGPRGLRALLAHARASPTSRAASDDLALAAKLIEKETGVTQGRLLRPVVRLAARRALRRAPSRARRAAGARRVRLDRRRLAHARQAPRRPRSPTSPATCARSRASRCTRRCCATTRST